MLVKLTSKILFIISFVTLMLTILFTGFSRDDEFSEANIFMKYRPTFQLCFDEPVGVDDTGDDVDALVQHMDYIDFVLTKHVTDKPIFIWILIFFAAITLCSFTLGIYQIKNITQLISWKLLLYLLTVVLMIAVSTSFMLLKNKDWVYIAGLTGILLLNYVSFLVFFKPRA